MQGRDTSVEVPQDETAGKLMTPSSFTILASSGVVSRPYPESCQLAARVVSPTNTTKRAGFVGTTVATASVSTITRGRSASGEASYVNVLTVDQAML